MLSLSVDNWHYLHKGPLFKATIKAQLSDFKVLEELSFEPSGEGEHTFLYIEKTGLNTAFVAEELAKFAKLPLRAVSYAGRKDKYATTCQWFGIYFGTKQAKSRKTASVKPSDIDWQAFTLAGIRIITVTQNDRKLRVGAIQANHFDIVLRNIEDLDVEALNERINAISEKGVPNYYGNQRFGELIKADGSVQLGGNLMLAEKLVNGEEIRNRNKNSMAISALRSWFFNHAVSHRISATKYMQVLDGDALSLSGTNSFFIHNAQEEEASNSIARIHDKDLNITAPLWGKGELDSCADALSFEQAFVQQHQQVATALENLGLTQQRRPVLIFPQDLQVQLSDNTVRLHFSLPSGCFATSVLRELADVSVGASALNAQ